LKKAKTACIDYNNELKKYHILILLGTNKWAYSVICQFWPMFSLNFF
jgi:hypothetical protein